MSDTPKDQPKDQPKDPWARFRTATRARIALGRSGDALPTKALLEFQLAHARARDAVHSAVDFARLATDLAPLETLRVHSAAADRPTYLRRPDLGRRLDPASAAALPLGDWDLLFVVADGLSAAPVHMPKIKFLCLMRNEGLARLATRFDPETTLFTIAEAGAAGSKPEGPFSTAKARSKGMVSPGTRSTAGSVSGEKPLTGYRHKVVTRALMRGPLEDRRSSGAGCPTGRTMRQAEFAQLPSSQSGEGFPHGRRRSFPVSAPGGAGGATPESSRRADRAQKGR